MSTRITCVIELFTAAEGTPCSQPSYYKTPYGSRTATKTALFDLACEEASA
jgi:hypothetical protein